MKCNITRCANHSLRRRAQRVVAGPGVGSDGEAHRLATDAPALLTPGPLGRIPSLDRVDSQAARSTNQ
jgi:hypothetical protein